MGSKNNLIAIIGIDGAGKTSQAKKLEEKLKIQTMSWKKFPPYPKLNGIHPINFIDSNDIIRRIELLTYYLNKEKEYLINTKKDHLTIIESCYVKILIKEMIFNYLNVEPFYQFDHDNTSNTYYIYIKTTPLVALSRKNNIFSLYESFGDKHEDFISFQNKQSELLDKFVSKKKHIVVDGLQNQDVISDIIINYLFEQKLI
jgi:thymidylate kinase